MGQFSVIISGPPGSILSATQQARYSKHYRITEEELLWLGGCVEELGRAVHAICSERIAMLEQKVHA